MRKFMSLKPMSRIRDYGAMLIRKSEKLIILAMILLLLVSCGNTGNSSSTLSDKVQTNFSNLDINVWAVGISGTTDFLVTSPKEIKNLRLDTDIPHTIYLEKVSYESSGTEGFFLQDIDYHSEEMSDTDMKKLTDAENMESISESFVNSDEVNNYYFYNAALNFADRTQFKEKEIITHMIVTTDEEEVIEIGKMHIMPPNYSDEYLEEGIIRNTSQAFGKRSRPSLTRVYVENQSSENSHGMSFFQVTKEIVIDKIELVNEGLRVEDMTIEVSSESGLKTYAFTEETFDSINLELKEGNAFNINTSFFVETDRQDLIYMQSYDFIVYYHDLQGNDFELVVDSGYITSSKNWFEIAASDEVKENIRDFYFEHLPRME